MARDLHRALITSAALASLAACGQLSSTDDGGDDGAPFIPFVDDFANFHSWTSTVGAGPPGAPQPPSAGIHDGVLTSYINVLPDAGSTVFPKGTIIVKEASDGGTSVNGRQSFAMVKRGGGYNAQGAVNWEWCELQNDAVTGVTRIVWCAAVPPSGETVRQHSHHLQRLPHPGQEQRLRVDGRLHTLETVSERN